MRTLGSPDELARLWALKPAPPEGRFLARPCSARSEVSYLDPVSGTRKIRPEIEAEIAEWVRDEVDRRTRRFGEEERAEPGPAG